MKILIVGYACNPYGGSEPGVGWTAVCRIARKHDVWVLTDIHNQVGWDKASQEGIIPVNVHVKFLRERSPCSSNRFIAHIQSWLNYRSFNNLVLATAESWHREIGFNLCHQVTVASWRMPSPLWKLPIPFVWGPIGGAGYISPAFRGMLSLKARLFEKARDIQTSIAIHSKAFLSCIRNTSVVFAANEETEDLLKPFRSDRPLIRLPIASLSPEKIERFRRPPKLPTEPDGYSNSNAPLRLFAGGNMEGRKGVSLALKALRIVHQRGVQFHYIIAGGGPEISKLQKLARDLGISSMVEFHSGYQGDEYIHALWASDVYFLPSFRESTPVTLLEAYLAGCYPVVADIGAQGEIVRFAGGHAVPASNIESLIKELADAVIWCGQNRSSLSAISSEATRIVGDHFSSERYDQVLAANYSVALTVS